MSNESSKTASCSPTSSQAKHQDQRTRIGYESDQIKWNFYQQIFDEALAMRPEWRFIQQDKHLKDILKLMIRNCSPTLELIQLNSFDAVKSWLCLMICQELEISTDVTRAAFELSMVESQRQKTPATHNVDPHFLARYNLNHNSRTQVNTIVSFAHQLFNLFNENLGWHTPWYEGSDNLESHMENIPSLWIQRIQTSMELLKEFNSIESNHKVI